MSRGRGYSGGPLRGAPRGRGSSEWTPRGRGRGYNSSYQPRGGGYMGSGGGGWYKDHQGGHQGGPPAHQQGYRNDRYLSAGSRPTESRYPSTRGTSSGDYNSRYSRRDAPPSYSSTREHNRSPDPIPRKRLRPEGYSPAGSRHSHDGGYEYSSSRYEYGSDKGSYNSEERGRPVYREERRPSTDRREDFHSPRSREPSGSSMPPPSINMRGSSYRSRGGVIRGRGVTRVFTRRPTDVSLAARKRTFIESYAAKRRILTGRSQDYYKKLKSIKLRSAFLSTRRDGAKSDEGESGDELENWDDELDDKELLSDNEESHKEGSEDAEDADGPDSKKTDAVRKIVKKVIVAKKVTPLGELESADSKETSKDEEGAEKGSDNQGREGDEETIEDEVADKRGCEPNMQVTIKHDSETRAVSDESGRRSSATRTGYKYIKLFCPHCKERYIAFKDYLDHLRGLPHINAMRKLSFRLKQNLARMRVEQRLQQRLEENDDEARGILGTRPNFCQTCKLNYRQDRSRHNESEMHKKMKEFLMPMCDACRINFRSPMLYENHICSLEHIKVEQKFMRGHGREHHAEREVDMDSLLVLDSVGSADESDSGDEALGDKSEGKDGERKEKKRKKAPINLGADFVNYIKVMYCSICEMYLPRTGEKDEVLAKHCRNRNHLQRFVRYKDDEALRKEAEKYYHRDEAEKQARNKTKEANKDVKSETSSSVTEKLKEDSLESKPGKITGDAENTDAGTECVDLDDKLWADVDKGLDELLREVEPGNKSSDDDDESGRYDRFRYSDKKSGKVSSEEMDAPDAGNSDVPKSVDVLPKQETTSPKED